MEYVSEMRQEFKRTANCGELRPEHIGNEVTLNGWVNRRRDHGGLIFVDLRDRSGLVQVVFAPQQAEQEGAGGGGAPRHDAAAEEREALSSFSPEQAGSAAKAHELAREVRAEYVLAVRGTVRRRPEGTENPSLPTGEVEVRATELAILNSAKTPPFSFVDETDTDELVRLKYRYFDLRSPRMQRNLHIRHKAAQATREFLSREGFWEIETTLLFRPTPEGARDYLVPSRVSPGNFYALPQSPQIMKQLTMIGGIEKYFQLPHCLRDEDLRADRQPEHTQIDIEMSFVTREDIFELTERLFAHIFREAAEIELPVPFPRMTHAEAMARYGTDKPDLRFGMELVEITEIARGCGFKVFAEVAQAGGSVKGLRAPGCADLPRAQMDKLTEFVRDHKAKGLAYFPVSPEGLEGPIAKFFGEAELVQIAEALEAEEGDMLMFVADEAAITNEALDWLRREMGERLGLIEEGAWAPLWVYDFPLLAWNEDEKRWDAEHHPFCMPHPEDIELLESDAGKVRALAYDVVLNGIELGSGSIRIHLREIQESVFAAMGMSREDAQRRFGFFLEAFEYGAPPHGGIAPGFDRIVMLMCGEPNIREVIAFPKTQRAQCLMSGAPAPADPAALKELHIKVDVPPSE